MGFQFNSVGGGTKTRRPIAIHMKVSRKGVQTSSLFVRMNHTNLLPRSELQYNASCSQPSCYLLDEDSMREQQMELKELQVWRV